MTSLPTLCADVAVIGAGPAGAVAALNLAPFLRVLVIDKGGSPAARVGENLPGAAGRLLRDMGLYDAFVAQGHAASWQMRSTWGDAQLWESDAIRNLDGPGWHLDRPRFDAWLREVAARRGAAFVDDTVMRNIGQAGGLGEPLATWRLELQRTGRPFTAEARFVIDASGRRAIVGRRLCGARESRDRLVCGWVFGTDSDLTSDTPLAAGGGGNELHAERGGWWYTASLPDRGRVLAFYTDADLPDAESTHSREALLTRLAGIPDLACRLDGCGFRADGAYGFCAANTAIQDAVAGPGWLAVGDAALAFDPLSSQGLFNALYTGLAGADAAYRFCTGSSHGSPDDYRRHVDGIRNAYLQNLHACYQMETRWLDMPFWQRRHAQMA